MRVKDGISRLWVWVEWHDGRWEKGEDRRVAAEAMEEGVKTMSKDRGEVKGQRGCGKMVWQKRGKSWISFANCGGWTLLCGRLYLHLSLLASAGGTSAVVSQLWGGREVV
ncbi:MAG: hypothetical protein ACKERG_03270 [Candidatus Hodgkinia cicadicola]